MHPPKSASRMPTEKDAYPLFECWAQLGRKTPPLRHEIRQCRRVRPTDSTGLMVGAVGIETATFHFVHCSVVNRAYLTRD